MSWSDPSRRFEPAEDVQLRAEMSELLGFEPAPRADAEPDPAGIRLRRLSRAGSFLGIP